MNTPVRVLGFRDLGKYPDAQIINTTSRSTNWTRAFSPFLLGPVRLYGGYMAKNVENAWQFSKVYPEHADEENNPTDDYFEWAKKGWGDSLAHRYPMGKGKIPLYSYWNGNKYEYVDARKKIYAPLYAKAVVRTEAFARLLSLYESGEPFVLLDFDGYDYLSQGLTLKDVLNDPKKKMGHAFVLAMLLQFPNFRAKVQA